MARGSYCWRGPHSLVCGDTIRPDGPLVGLRRGEVIRFRLGFQPAEVLLTVGRKTYSVPAWRTIPWRVRGASGSAALFATRPGGGDASYFATFRIRPAGR
jgi:hypothetical protein